MPRLPRFQPHGGALCLPRPEAIAFGTGAGRLVLGMTFLVAPVVAVRVLGVDSATAKRVTFLARMAAARDLGLAAGTIAAGPTAAAVPWLVAAAAVDAVDAVVIAGAIRTGTAHGPLAAGTVVAAALTAVAGVWGAAGLRGR